MKKVYRILLIIGIAWVGVTLFFYSQHRVMARVCNVDREIIVGDYTLMVEYVVIKNYEQRTDLGSVGGVTASFDLKSVDSLFFKFAHRLPDFILKPGFYIAYFYNRPYEFNNKFQNTVVKTHFILDETIEREDYHDIGEKVGVKLVDSIGVGYASGMSISSSSDSNIIQYWVSGKRLPKERINEPFTIVITDKVNDIAHEITINPEDFKKESYGFFNRSPYENY